MRFASDTGGTFTDLLVEDDGGSVSLYKASTTPADPIAGVMDALGLAAAERGLPLRDGRQGVFHRVPLRPVHHQDETVPDQIRVAQKARQARPQLARRAVDGHDDVDGSGGTVGFGLAAMASFRPRP